MPTCWPACGRSCAGPLLVGIWSGGAWLAERLQRDLARPGEHGVISSTLHRDDFGSRGLYMQRRDAAAVREVLN